MNSSRSANDLDNIDWKLLDELQADARLSYNELARRAGRRRPDSSPGRCLLRSSAAEDYPEVVEVDKLSGQHCSMLRVRASSLAHLEGVLEQIGKYGEMDTHIVLSTQYRDPRVRRNHPDRPVTASAGWTRQRAGASDSADG